MTTNGTGNAYGATGCGGTDCGVFFKAFGGNATTGDYMTGRLSQLILYNAADGDKFHLTGWAGAEANFSGLIPGTVTKAEIAVDFLGPGQALISSASLDLVSAGLGTPNGEAFNYQKFSVAGFAPAGTLFVRPRISLIDGYSNPAGGGQAFVVDDFSLQQVPEPATLAMAGVSLIGALGLRRRS